MKNSPWCLRIQVYFFKIHSKSDNFLPHSTIFYLYCCNKFLTSFFFSYSCPFIVYSSHTGQHDLLKMHIISHSSFTSSTLLASPLLVTKPKFLPMACQALCGLAPAYRSLTLSFTTFPCSLGSSITDFAVLQTHETSACSGLSLDICMAVSHHSGLSSCSLYR